MKHPTRFKPRGVRPEFITQLRAYKALKIQARAWRAESDQQSPTQPQPQQQQKTQPERENRTMTTLATISRYPGANPTLRANAYLLDTNPAHRALPYREQIYAAGQLLKSLQAPPTTQATRGPQLRAAPTAHGHGYRLASDASPFAGPKDDEEPEIRAFRAWIETGAELIIAAREKNYEAYSLLVTQAFKGAEGDNVPRPEATGEIDLRSAMGNNRTEKAAFVLAARDPSFAQLSRRDQIFQAGQALRNAKRIIE